MKRYLKYILVAGICLISGCIREDINSDPTKSKKMNPAYQLAYIQINQSGNRFEQWRTNQIVCMAIVQHMSGPWANGFGARYIWSEPYMTATWQSNYPREVKNVTDLVQRTEGKADQININAAGKVMLVYVFHRLTDLHGDIPYSEAAQAYREGIFRPKYDEQEKIYSDFFVKLDESVSQFDASKDAIPNDLFFEGNIEKWKRFANSLRLRLALRLIKVNPSLAKKEAEKAIKAGVMENLDDSVILYHEDYGFDGETEDPRGNGLSQSMNIADVYPYLYFNERFVKKLRETKDPRITSLGKILFNKNGTFTDLTPYIVSVNDIMGIKDGSYSYENPQLGSLTIIGANGKKYELVNQERALRINPELVRNNTPFIHMSYAEIEFLLAECAIRWQNTGQSAQEHFEKGLKAAINSLSLLYGIKPEIPEDRIQQFIANNPLKKGSEIQQINEQLWIVHLLNGIEAFANWRRSGYPVLSPINYPETETGGVTPRRLKYPLFAKSQNSKNADIAIQRLGGSDDWTLRVWWDKE